jgi:mono/diheme cytochrome c family protein
MTPRGRPAHAAMLLVVAWSTACAREAALPSAATLGFVAADGAIRRVPLVALAEAAAPVTVRSDDPYYGAERRFSALPIGPALARGFGLDSPEALRGETLRFRARDGYEVLLEGATLLDDGALLAFDDLDAPGFAPIGPQRVSPGPLYLIWRGRRPLATHPRPWQLDTVARVDPRVAYAHLAPRGEPPEGPAYRGFALFRRDCLRCHAINREGGRVGPDLNVPENILAYRPEAQVRAFIRDPSTFRYSQMPPHPELTGEELDALIAYLRAMATRQHDGGP